MDVSADAARQQRPKVERCNPAQLAMIAAYAGALVFILLADLLARSGPSWGQIARLVATILPSLFVAYAGVRDWPLALAISLSPVPAVLAALAPPLGQAGEPFSLGALIYGLGYAVALTAVDRQARAIVAETAAVPRWHRFPAGALLAGFGPACALALAAHGQARTAGLELALANALAIGFGLLAAPAALPFAALGEDFIASFNRSREDWARFLERAATAAEPPWSGSVVGILMVFLVMAAFGMGPIRSLGPNLIPLIAIPATLLASAVVVARDPRRSAALFVSAFGPIVIAAWVSARAHLASGAPYQFAMIELAGLSFVLAAAVSECAGGEDFVLSIRTAILSAGPAAVLSALLAIWAVIAAVSGRMAVLWVLMAGLVFVVYSMLTLQGALLRTLETHLPRPRTLAERYRVK